MANTNHLLDEIIDVAVAALKVQKWTATLPFSGFLCKPTDDVLMASFQDRHDLFSLTQTIYKGFIVRFDPQTFPVVPGGVAKNKDSIKKLFDALMCASHHHGFCQLVSHNQNTAGRKYLCCANFQIHRQSKAAKAVVRELRQSTTVCDRKNSRDPQGQSLPKRTNTSKATTLEDTCKVKLAFDADSISIFLICGIGESQHEGHRPRSASDMVPRKRYNIEHVENAMAVTEEHHISNAVSMTQEMHNCSADFSFVGPGDETSDVADPVGSHEVLNPLYKELTQLCDIAGKDKTAKTARDLETLIIALKEEIASEQSPPTGKVVSCMVSKVSGKRKHVKQFKY